MATFSATFTTPGIPDGFTRTIAVDDGIWGDVLTAIRESSPPGVGPENEVRDLTEEECINIMLRTDVDSWITKAKEIQFRRLKADPGFQIIA